jgi:hypothetical protein
VSGVKSEREGRAHLELLQLLLLFLKLTEALLNVGEQVFDLVTLSVWGKAYEEHEHMPATTRDMLRIGTRPTHSSRP